MNVAMLPEQKMQQTQKKQCNNYLITEPTHVPRHSCWCQFSISLFTIHNCRNYKVLTAHSFLASHFKSTSFTGNGGIPVLSCLGLGNCKTGRSKFARAWGSTKERGWYEAQKRLSSKWRASLELWTWRKMSERKNWRFYQLNGQTGVIASFAIDWRFYQLWLSPDWAHNFVRQKHCNRFGPGGKPPPPKTNVFFSYWRGRGVRLFPKNTFWSLDKSICQIGRKYFGI